MDLANVPEHMPEDAEYFNHYSPEFYQEAECEHCGRPIYRYEMDLIVEWKHFDHYAQCNPLRAKPRVRPE